MGPVASAEFSRDVAPGSVQIAESAYRVPIIASVKHPLELTATVDNRSISSRWFLVVNATAALLLTGVIVLYLGLIGLGQWQADEYDNFSRLRTRGWRFLFDRLHWSPRPISELILMMYGWTVNQTHQPLIAPFLGLLWIVFIGSGLLGFFQARGKRSREENWLAFVAAASLMASFLVGGGLTEVFYWPVGAGAYLLTLSCGILFFWQAAEGRLATSRGRALSGIALSIAACSSEMGAMLVASYAFMKVAGWTIERLTRRVAKPAGTTILWWLLPALISLVVLSALGLNRFQQSEPGFTVASSTLGHPLLSVGAAVRGLLSEVSGVTPGLRPSRGMSGLLSEIMMLVGIGLCRPLKTSSKESAREITNLVSALLLACLLSLTTTYLHFGTAGGQRHQLLRHCWILMAASGMGMLLFSSQVAARVLVWSKRTIAGAIVLCLAVLVPWHTGELVREYRAYPSIKRAIRENFESGFQCGNDPVIYVLPPNKGVLAFAQIEPGTYTAGSGALYPAYILKFFGKRTLVVRVAQ